MYTLDCYVNSLYTIFLPHTHTHTTLVHIVPLAVAPIGFSFSHCFHEVYMCMNVHTCAHTLLCTQPVHHIFVTHTAHTHTVHLHCYEMESCAQHIHTLMYSTLVRTRANEKPLACLDTLPHMYIASKVYSKLVLCTCTCIVFHLTALCMYVISIPCPFAPCMWSALIAGSLYIHHSLRCEIKLSYWAQPLLNFFLFAMLSFVLLA